MFKRGQGLSTNAIILIILGVVVLVVLIVGFTVGWGTIAPWISSDNVDDIATQCQTACSTQSVYGFCSQLRELKAEGETLPPSSCYQFATNESYTKFGISGCPALEGQGECVIQETAE